MDHQQRHPLATISISGISFFHRQNPYIVAWWSAAFPGFGHFLLQQYLRATILTLFEVSMNTLAHINEAIVYSFCGRFETAKSVLQPRWVFGYFIIYLYAIWDSYRSTLTHNKLCHLAEFEKPPIKGLLLHPFEIQYLEQKPPLIAALYSFFFPGLGQLYNHRFWLAFYAMFWWWLYLSFSRGYESLFLLLLGNFQESVAVLNMHWLMFMPSVAGGSIYHAFITAIEHNRLYCLEQRRYFAEHYGNSKVCLFP